MLPANFEINLQEWKQKNKYTWALEHECQSCFKLFRAEINLQFFDPFILNEEVPLMASISSGFFLVKDMVQTVHYPLIPQDRSDIQKHMNHTAQQLGGLILSHYMENKETHFKTGQLDAPSEDL